MPRFGRLFWKFFAFFWLAQLTTALVVGLLIWGMREEHAGNGPRPAHGPMAPMAPRFQAQGLAPPSRPPPRALFPRMPIVAGSLVSLVFAALLAWYFSRPIRALRAALEAVAAGKLGTRVGHALMDRRDELADLGTAFDAMAEQLQGVVEGQQRLLHDVSHELRSPLARLQAVSDLIAQQPERAGDLLPRIERECGRMDHLVGELLTLARLDRGGSTFTRELLDLSLVLEDAAQDAEVDAVEKALAVLTQLPGNPVPFHGDNQLLLRALSNLTRNAIRHAPQGSTIELTLTTSATLAEITVTDRGPGVAKDELERIFEPFMRGRNGPSGEGYGLGLAITRRIVHAHGGTISAHPRPGGGLVMKIALPLQPGAKG